MKYNLIFLLLLLLIVAQADISPALDTARRQVISIFIHKLEDSFQLAVGNLTAYAYIVNDTLEYELCTDNAGCFAGILASDYLGIVFVQVPITTSSGTTYTQFTKLKFNLFPTSIVLAEESDQGDRYTYQYYINATQLNPLTGGTVDGDGIGYTGNIVFAPNTSKVMTEVVSSLLGQAFFNSAAGAVPALQLCSGIVGIATVVNGSCPPGSPYQQFSSLDDCLTKMAEVVATQSVSPCNDILTSNSTACRNVHYVTALANQPQSQIDHCPHVQIPSPVCIDRCLVNCSNCDPNAQCVFVLTLTGSRVYSCLCNPGYVGNGTTCTRVTCSAQYDCATGDNYNYVACINGTCACQPSFEWDTTLGTCVIPEGTNVVYNNGQAVALPLGRCYEQWQCSNFGLGGYNDLTCVQFGVNAFVPYLTCICNYGYDGGFNVPCTCASGKTITWSSQLNSNVCLFPYECAASYDCSYGQSCNTTNSGYPGVIGVCM